MLLIVDGNIYERRLTEGINRIVVSAAAHDGLPGTGHAIIPDMRGVVYCFDYKMVWGNLVYEPAEMSCYWKRHKYLTEDYLMRSRNNAKHSRKQSAIRRVN